MVLFFFFNDTATTEIYTRSIVGSVRCVQETGYQRRVHGLSGKASRSSCSIEFVIPKQTNKPLVSIYNIKGQKVRSWRVNNSYQDMQKHGGLRKKIIVASNYTLQFGI
eukprot:TRINITY_DN67723_c0_g1_i1.p4 TRINITY_DN67723_c0_g1~~TRINITY_DN67723_c0_g1_i1.p4  ORF type:complete len:108 (-),score=26.12 TRINITY_DN67723_c0_g1_i1:192-515(-)